MEMCVWKLFICWGFFGLNGFMEFFFIAYKSKWMFVNYAIVCESCIHILFIYRAWGGGGGGGEGGGGVMHKIVH